MAPAGQTGERPAQKHVGKKGKQNRDQQHLARIEGAKHGRLVDGIHREPQKNDPRGCDHPFPQPAPALPPTTHAAPAAAPGVRVWTQVSSGLLVGRAVGGVRAWQGVPYAAAPVGGRRWKVPQPAPLWVGERDAAQPGNVCVQPRPGGGLRGAEDCLYLNVYAPEATTRAPVGRTVVASTL